MGLPRGLRKVFVLVLALAAARCADVSSTRDVATANHQRSTEQLGRGVRGPRSTGGHPSAAAASAATATRSGKSSPFFDSQRSTRPVVVVTTQRSGSGWVLRMLESKAPPLDYRNKEPFGLLGHRVRDYNSEDEDAFADHVAQVFGERCDNASAVACGFKVMYNQLLHPHVFFDFCAAHNVSIVHLVRQNVLRRYISLHYLRLDHSRSQVTKEQAAQLGQQWKQEPFDFDEQTGFAKLATMLREVQAWRDALREAGLRGVESIEIAYEQLQHPRTCAAFLGFVAPELMYQAEREVDCSLAPEFSDVQQHGEYHCGNFIRNWDNFTARLRSSRDGLSRTDVDFIIRQCESGIRHVATFDDVADQF